MSRKRVGQAPRGAKSAQPQEAVPLAGVVETAEKGSEGPETPRRAIDATSTPRPAGKGAQQAAGDELRDRTGSAPVSAEAKEKRARRYTSDESCRRGLADVANRVRTGELDPKRGAVIVQAIHEILTILGVRQATEIDAKAAALEQEARAAGLPEEEAYGRA